jgi:hypothetical protein
LAFDVLASAPTTDGGINPPPATVQLAVAFGEMSVPTTLSVPAPLG